MTKICTKCKEEKDIDEYFKDKYKKDGLTSACKKCKIKDAQISTKKYRKNSGNKSTNKYEKSYNGYIMRMYHNMQSRVKGLQKKKAHLYKGKEIIPKEEFYEWIKTNQVFNNLFDVYKESNYERKLAPSVDRVDSKLGYIIPNMEIITMSENSRRGAKAKL